MEYLAFVALMMHRSYYLPCTGDENSRRKQYLIYVNGKNRIKQHLENKTCHCLNMSRKKIAFELSSGASRRRMRTMGKSTPTIISLTNEFSTRHVFFCQMSRIRIVLDTYLIFLVVVKQRERQENIRTICFHRSVIKDYKIIVIKSDKIEFDKTI